MPTVMLGFIAFVVSVSVAGAQCTPAVPGPGTVCQGPIAVQAPNPPTFQTSVILVDIGLPQPAPAVGKYILSIKDGVIVESDNSGAYHTLVGPKGDTGADGKDGINGTNGLNGTNGKDGAPGAQGPQGLPGIDSFQIGSSMTVIVTSCNLIGVGRTCVLKRVK